jgi:STE24 endopeptidase
MSLATQVFSISEPWFQRFSWLPSSESTLVREIIEASAILGSLGLFFWFVFGNLSRRFERQADVFGCKVVSCGTSECPPHLDLEEGILAHEPIHRGAPTLCPVGIQIFASALSTVARQNGIEATARSWRHGSIANRLAFLRQLEANPGREPLFQRGIRSYRFALSAFLLTTLALAVMTHSWDLWH